MLPTQHLPLATHFYDGSQLRSGWIRDTFGLEGDAIVAFTGPCDVSPDHMLDLEDLQAGESIRATLMLHFIIEHHGIDLALAVARQRLLAAVVREILTERWQVRGLTRSGDDLYLGDRKLSISIAAPSPVSALIHFAVNIDPSGAPVPAIGLQELNVGVHEFARQVQEAYVAEIASCDHAATKVRPAR